MQAGDVIFFGRRGKSPTAKLNVSAQWLLTRQRQQFTHVAISLYGPLVVHAMPEGGVQFSVLEKELLEQSRYTVARPAISADAVRFGRLLERAAVYWLGERYSILASYREAYRTSATAIGINFCSYLVQKIYSMMGVGPFDAMDRPHTPTQLFNLLKRSDSWMICEQQSLLAEGQSHLPIASKVPPTISPEETITTAKQLCGRMSLRAAFTVAEGGFSFGGKILADLALLAAFTQGDGPLSAVKRIKEEMHPLAAHGLELNYFLFYRNYLPLLLRENGLNTFEAPDELTWMYAKHINRQPINIRHSIREWLDAETLQVKNLFDNVRELLRLREELPIDRRVDGTLIIISFFLNYLQGIGAEECLDRSLDEQVADLTRDLHLIQNCTVLDAQEERASFAKLIMGKIALLKMIEITLRNAGYIWPLDEHVKASLLSLTSSERPKPID